MEEWKRMWPLNAEDGTFERRLPIPQPCVLTVGLGLEVTSPNPPSKNPVDQLWLHGHPVESQVDGQLGEEWGQAHQWKG